MIKYVLNLTMLCLALLPISARASDLALLSNNIGPGKNNADFPAGTKVLPTKMTTTWITAGEFATDEETVSTSRGGAVLFDGNTGSNWKSRTYSKWSGKKWATLVVDLGEPYALGVFDVWALHEESRDTELFHVLLSDDGKTYTPQGVASSQDVPLEKGLMTKIHLALEAPVKARYVQFRIQRRKAARQQQIGEIAIWGVKPQEGVSYLESDSRPTVAFTVQTIQSGVVKIDWSQSSKLNAGVKQWKIYKSAGPFESVNQGGVELVNSFPGASTHAVIYPLKPGGTLYFGMTAVYEQGEYPKVKAVATRMPLPLECDTFGDMVAINHFWGGGGSRVSHGPNQDAYERIALELLGQTGIKQTRWWRVDAEVFRRFYEQGIGVYTYPHGNNIRAASALGVNAIAGPKNEPDLSTMPIGGYIKRLAEFYKKKESENPDMVMCAPSSGLEDHSIDWLDKFYQQGGKPYFDVLDLHSYCKISGGHKVPEGYPAGAPEAMYDNMRKIRSVLAKHGDQDKPVISTEFGYSDAKVNNPSGKITLLSQAQYIVRGLVIHHALGFKRVFLYSFWDEGTDINFSEHRFGLIDFDLQKKPAYHAVKTVIEQLGDCRLKGPVANMSLPSLGYVYQQKDGGNLVHVVWDGVHPRNGVFQTKAKVVRQVDMFGAETQLIPDDHGRIGVVYGGSPVYLHADQAIVFVSSEKAKPVGSQSELQVQLDPKPVIVAPGASQALLPVSVENPRSHDVSLKLMVMDEQQNKLAEQRQTVSAQKHEQLAVRIALNSQTPVLSKLTLHVIEQQASGLGATSSSYPFFVRKLHPASGQAATIQAPVPGLEKPVMVLANDKLEVSIDAWRGGRVLEVIDRRTGSNQVNIDYGVLPDLLNVPFAFGIWDTFNGKLKNSPMKILKAQDGRLELEATAGELQIRQVWELEGATLTLTNAVANRSGSAVKLKYKSHPEYTVGGTGDSVDDVIYLPMQSGIEKLPFWSGLGDKPLAEFAAPWWAAVDTKLNVALKQQFGGEGWATPRLWFGQGHYNVELSTQPNFTLAAGQTWQSRLKWSVIHVDPRNIEGSLNRE